MRGGRHAEVCRGVPRPQRSGASDPVAHDSTEIALAEPGTGRPEDREGRGTTGFCRRFDALGVGLGQRPPTVGARRGQRRGDERLVRGRHHQIAVLGLAPRPFGRCRQRGTRERKVEIGEESGERIGVEDEVMGQQFQPPGVDVEAITQQPATARGEDRAFGERFGARQGRERAGVDPLGSIGDHHELGAGPRHAGQQGWPGVQRRGERRLRIGQHLGSQPHGEIDAEIRPAEFGVQHVLIGASKAEGHEHS